MRRTRWINAALALYPAWWRDRYGEEVRTVSADAVAGGQSLLRVTTGLTVGAIRSRATGAGMPQQFPVWARRTRACIVVATIPALVMLPLIFFTFKQGQQNHLPLVSSSSLSEAGHIAYGAFGIMALAGLMALGTIISGYASLAGAVRRTSADRPRRRVALVVVLAAAFVVVGLAAGTVAFFGLVAVGIVVWGFLSMRRAVRHGNGDDRALRNMVPIPALLALLAVIIWVTSELVGPHRFKLQQGVDVPLNGHPALAHGLLLAAATSLGLGWIATFGLLVLVSQRAHITLDDLYSGRLVGLTLSVLLWVMAAAAVVSAVALSRQGSMQQSTYSVVTTSWGHWWFAGALGLMVAATVSTLGAVAARQAWRVAAGLNQSDALGGSSPA